MAAITGGRRFRVVRRLVTSPWPRWARCASTPVVLGCCGLTADDGPTACDLDEPMEKKAAVASARRVIAATDSEIGRNSRVPAGRCSS